VAQFKAVTCGIGYGLNMLVFGRWIMRFGWEAVVKGWESQWGERAREGVWRLVWQVSAKLGATMDADKVYEKVLRTAVDILRDARVKQLTESWVGKTMGLIGFGWFMVKWYGLLVKGKDGFPSIV
jgi:hypothetical protein